MIPGGYILLYRSIYRNWVWSDPEFLRAWIWMLMKANYEDNQILFSGQFVNLKRGEFVTSLNTIVWETGLTEKRARTFLKNLKNGQMIGIQTGSKWTKITVCNYDDYQDGGQNKGKQRATEGADKGQTEGNRELNKTNKRRKKRVFVPPELKDFIKYFEDNGYPEQLAKRVWKGYDEAGWKDSKGKPILSWKQKCQHVWFNDENIHKAKAHILPDVKN